ncbi:dynamin family protein [Microbacterium kyungheense]|uniref:Replication fork clamp-binding protein CrfC n=1 Tax=Microbacterium kyungheense TaxID=1263636 RepID=A0A543FK96_9MICO|nr:dynamin family protein [Microbacterium kyungheense]TQM34136.1 replication fork clamp-binding protein CrfC [Microbacterium kyungheense]
MTEHDDDAHRDDRVPAAPPDADGALLELVGQVGRAAAQAGRRDLVRRLIQTRDRLRDPHVRVIIVGEFKQGKSKLVNALVNAPACPVDDDIATTVPTVVGYASEASASVLVQPEGEGNVEPRRDVVPLAELADFVSAKGNPENIRRIISAEVLLPREILRGGLRLVDSPGVGGLDSRSALLTLSALSSAHAVILVSDASQEYTEPEMQFLRHAMRVSPNVAAVLAKTDLYPEWREIERIDRSHLSKIGDIPMFSVSSDLRLLAAETRDAELNDESGFPDLVGHLRQQILERAEQIHERSALHDLASVVEQLTIALRSELTALVDPDESPRLLVQLEEAKSRADEFRSRSARWQVTLTDGVADLIADMEHDLRDRLRKVQREAEASIDDGDPGPIWDQITEWLDQRISSAVSETFVWTDERARWLSEQVAELFLEGEESLPAIDVADAAGVLDPVEAISDLDEGRMSAAEKIFIGVRGSYGGVLMVGLATGLIGLPLINPLSLIAGVIVGRRAFREDMGNRLARRQAEAKNIVRRHIDEVIFQAGKQLKDRLRVVQRTARDHFGALADELHRSFTEAMTAAKQAASVDSGKREQRVKTLGAQLRQLETLRTQIAAPAVAPPPERAAIVR